MDLVILQWVTALTACVCLLTLLILRRLDPDEPSLRLFIICVAFIGISNLVGALRDSLPLDLAIIVSNVTGVIGALYLVQAVRVLLGKTRGPQVQWVIAFAYTFLVMWFTIVHPDQPMRKLFISAMTGAVFAYCSWLLWRHREDGVEPVLKASAVMTSVMTLLCIVRVAVIPVHGEAAVSSSSAITMLYLPSTVMWTVLTLMVGLIVATRTHLRLAEAKEAIEDANLRLLEMSWLDPGTHVTNRSRIGDLLTSGVQSNAQFGVPLAVMLLTVEDSSRLGLDPRTVDGSMSEVAAILRTAMQLHEPDFETLGRWGDDAYLILLNGMSRNEALEVARRISNALENVPHETSWDSFRIGVTSCGPEDSAQKVLDRVYEGAYGTRADSEHVRFV